MATFGGSFQRGRYLQEGGTRRDGGAMLRDGLALKRVVITRRVVGEEAHGAGQLFCAAFACWESCYGEQRARSLPPGDPRGAGGLLGGS